jgi:hypothetical protein
MDEPVALVEEKADDALVDELLNPDPSALSGTGQPLSPGSSGGDTTITPTHPLPHTFDPKLSSRLFNLIRLIGPRYSSISERSRQMQNVMMQRTAIRGYIKREERTEAADVLRDLCRLLAEAQSVYEAVCRASQGMKLEEVMGALGFSDERLPPSDDYPCIQAAADLRAKLMESTTTRSYLKRALRAEYVDIVTSLSAGFEKIAQRALKIYLVTEEMQASP